MRPRTAKTDGPWKSKMKLERLCIGYVLCLGSTIGCMCKVLCMKVVDWFMSKPLRLCIDWFCVASTRKDKRLDLQGPVHESGRLVHVKTPRNCNMPTLKEADQTSFSPLFKEALFRGAGSRSNFVYLRLQPRDKVKLG